MIEQIQATGLSGATGKTGKHAKNHAESSLFGKLLTMFGKHISAAVQGNGFKRDSAVVNQGKRPLMSAEKGASILTLKNSRILAEPAKVRHGDNMQAEETATPLVAAYIIADVLIQGKTVSRSGKAIVLSLKQTDHVKGEQANPALNQLLPAGTKMVGRQSVQLGKIRQTIQTGNQPLMATSEKNATPALARQPLATASAGVKSANRLSSTPFAKTEPVSISQQSVQFNDARPAPVLSGEAQAVEPAAKGDALLAPKAGSVIGGQQSVQFNDARPAPVLSGKAQAVEPVKGEALVAPKADSVIGSQQSVHIVEMQPNPVSGRQALSEPQLEVENRVRSSLLMHKATSAPLHAQHKADAAKAAPAVYLQKGQSLQTEAGQNVNLASLASTITRASVSGASLTDSGAQFSDSDGQDSRTFSALGGDAKSSAAASSTTFQNYLTGKAGSGMSVFDSMKHIAQSAKNGKTRLDIQLEPAHLGKIQISLHTDAARQLHVHISVEQTATRQMIDQQLPALRHALAQQGLDMSGFSMDSHGEQAFAGFNNGRGGSKPARSAFLPENPVNLPASNLQSATHHSGGLSIHV